MANLMRYVDQPLVARGDSIESIALTPEPLAEQGFMMGTTTAFPPGTALRLRYHNCIEQVTVGEGEAVAELNGRELASPYDTTRVPAGEPHHFINTGAGSGAVHVTPTFPDTGEIFDQFHAQ